MRHKKTSDIKETLSTSREDVLVSVLSMRRKEPNLSATSVHNGWPSRPKRLDDLAMYRTVFYKWTERSYV